MKALPLIVPDDDTTRQRLIEAHAWAGGIHREDIPRVTDAARRHWEILADTSLRELRLLSVAHRDGIEDATGGAVQPAPRQPAGRPQPTDPWATSTEDAPF